MKEYTVAIGDYKVVKGVSIIKTVGLGSCVALALYDPMEKVGGLAHIMLPRSNGKSANPKYADHAIELMLNEMLKLGARKKNIVAKMAGGAQIFKHITTDSLKIGERNVRAIEEILGENNIKIVSKDVGGTAGRSVFFYTEDGRMLVKYSNGVKIWI